MHNDRTVPSDAYFVLHLLQRPSHQPDKVWAVTKDPDPSVGEPFVSAVATLDSVLDSAYCGELSLLYLSIFTKPSSELITYM
jgi:hypothetical protein